MGPDYYTTWLGILPGRRPPDHYTLLGLKPGAGNPREIEKAAYAQLDKLDRFSLSPERERREACQRLMNEVAKARVVLMDSASRAAYDRAQGFAGDHGGMGEGSEPESSPALEAALRQVSAAPAEAPAPYELAPGPGAKRPGGAAPGGGRGGRLIAAAAIVAVLALVAGGVAAYYLLRATGAAPPTGAPEAPGSTALSGVAKTATNTGALPALASNVPRDSAVSHAPPLLTAPLVPPPTPSPAQADATLKTQTTNVVGPEGWPDDGPIPTVPEDVVTGEKLRALHETVSASQREAIKARIQAIMATPITQKGRASTLYTTSMGYILDDFFPVASLKPSLGERESAYWKWHFVGGRLVSIVGVNIESNNSYRIWYNQRHAPVLMAPTAPDASKVAYRLADYDEQGHLRRTVALDRNFNPLRFSLFTPVGPKWDADFYWFDQRDGMLNAQYYRNGGYYLWNQMQKREYSYPFLPGQRLKGINSFVTHGLQPVYPLPGTQELADSPGTEPSQPSAPAPEGQLTLADLADATTPEKIARLRNPMSDADVAAVEARINSTMTQPQGLTGPATVLYSERFSNRTIGDVFPFEPLRREPPPGPYCEWRFIQKHLVEVDQAGPPRAVLCRVWYERDGDPVLVVKYGEGTNVKQCGLIDYNKDGSLWRTVALVHVDTPTGQQYVGLFSLYSAAPDNGEPNTYTFNTRDGSLSWARYYRDGMRFNFNPRSKQEQSIGSRAVTDSANDFVQYGLARIYPRAGRLAVAPMPPVAGTPPKAEDTPKQPELSVPSDWVTLFRSDKPELWNTQHETGDDFALPFNRAPHNMRYLRLRRLDTGDTVIIEMAYNELPREGTSFEPCWQGTKVKVGHAYRLGIMGQLNAYGSQNQGAIQLYTYGRDARSGWGFGNRAGINDVQGFCWAGQPIDPTAMEVSVSAADLTPLERSEVLRLGRR